VKYVAPNVAGVQGTVPVTTIIIPIIGHAGSVVIVVRADADGLAAVNAGIIVMTSAFAADLVINAGASAFAIDDLVGGVTGAKF